MKIVEEYRPDVVYAHHTIPNGYFAMRIQRQTGVPFVVTDHETGEITACETFPARKAIYKKITQSARRMVSVSEGMRREMGRVFPLAPAEVIHNGMEQVPEEEKQAKGSQKKEDQTVILGCGMFYERKNFPGLIQAFNLVASKHPQAVLRIVGDGPDRGRLEEERRRSPHKQRIELAGRLSHAEVLRQMRAADIFALIGWAEPFGVVFLEAMAAGLPVVACADAGVAEVMTGAEIPDDPALATWSLPPRANGVLVPPKDIPAAGRALEFLLLNPEARRQIGAEAQRKVLAEFTWDSVVGKYMGVFREAVGKG